MPQKIFSVDNCQVILEVAPESLYNDIFTKLLKSSFFELSSHHCGNFVVQALISHARTKDQMEMIWEELGFKFADLLGMGRSGIIASLIAACQRLQTHEYKCCEALATAVCSKKETSKFIVPRILFVDSYFSHHDKSSWNWPGGAKMHVMGSLILLLASDISCNINVYIVMVMQYLSLEIQDWIQPYILSITSMETEHVLEAAKDARGARVIEAFLASDASTKQKRRLVVKGVHTPPRHPSSRPVSILGDHTSAFTILTTTPIKSTPMDVVYLVA
ncbi:hypothetical protein V6N13_144134 [Hibiscus sabdariffa]